MINAGGEGSSKAASEYGPSEVRVDVELARGHLSAKGKSLP